MSECESSDSLRHSALFLRGGVCDSQRVERAAIRAPVAQPARRAAHAAAQRRKTNGQG